MKKEFLKNNRYYVYYDKDGKLLGSGQYLEFESHERIESYPDSCGCSGIITDDVEYFMEIPENYHERWNKDG